MDWFQILTQPMSAASGEVTAPDGAATSDNEPLPPEEAPEAEATSEEAPEAEVPDPMGALRQAMQTLQQEKEALERTLAGERAQWQQERQESAVKQVLLRNGAVDADYLYSKLTDRVQLDETGALCREEELLAEAKQRYPRLFEAGDSLHIEGLRPGDGGMGQGGCPDTGFLTYSQEQRLLGRG